MKNIILLITILVFFPNIFWACLNENYGFDKYGNYHLTDEYREPFKTDFNYKEVEQKLISLHKKLTKEKSIEVLSDYAVYLLKGKKTEEALIILQTLAFHNTDNYSISANLGTAYELSGMPDSALKYIQRGIELNPNSHGGSEWIHVKILETKIAQKTQPDFLLHHTVLNLSAQDEKDMKICQDILIQLTERFPFCPGPDSIMASLVIDLGDCYANLISVEVATGVYLIAKNYFGDASESLQEKINETKKLSNQNENKPKPHTPEEMDLKGADESLESHNTDRELLENPNKPPYDIQWEKINTNTDSLLAFVGLTPIVFEPNNASEIWVESPPEPAQEKEPIEEYKSNSMLYFIFGLVLILFFVGLVVLRFRKKS